MGCRRVTRHINRCSQVKLSPNDLSWHNEGASIEGQPRHLNVKTMNLASPAMCPLGSHEDHIAF